MSLTPFVLDLILLGVAVEAIVLTVLLRRAGRPGAVFPLWLFLASGAALLGAFRLHLGNTPAPWPAAALGLGFITHAALLWRVARAGAR